MPGLMKVAIIGAGEIAGYHLQVLKEVKTIEVCAICDVDLPRANALGQSFGLNNAYENHSEMIAKENPDVVHVLTPPKFHTPISIEAMESGCHVLVEKPMALTYKDALKMVSTGKRTGKHLAICEMFLFDPVIIKAQNLLKQGFIGKLIHVESYWFTDVSGNSSAYSLKGGGSGWAHSLPGGVFANFLDHPVYLQRELLDKVNTINTTWKKIGLNPFVPYDELRINLSSDDKTGYIVSSLNGKPRINLLRLYGTEGVITADMSNLTITTMQNRSLPSFINKGLSNINQSLELMKDTFNTTTAILRKKIKARQGMRTFLHTFYNALSSPNSSLDESSVFNCLKASETIRLLENIWSSIPPESNNEKHFQNHLYININTAGETVGTNRSRALVTGAGGFLGNHLVEELLKKNYIVRVMTRKINRKWEENNKVEVLYGDIRDQQVLDKAAQGVDTIYHCAALTTNKGPWQNFVDTNINATRNLLDCAVKFKVGRFIFVSSVAVYGFNRTKEIKSVDENNALGNGLPYYSFYAKSKIEGEKLVWDYYRKDKLPVVIIRPGVIYGPRPNGKNIFKTKKIIFGAKNKILPYVYVKDVVNALLLTGTSDSAVGNAFNVVGDEQLTQGNFNDKVNHIVGSKKSGIFLPLPLMLIPAFLLEFYSKKKKANSSPPFNMYFYKSLVRNLYYDNGKIKKELGWIPNYSIEDGIKETHKYYHGQVLN
jgi:nucleoside-diphosphate-sugar epimerase/predicted dehydrogenase